MKEKRSKGAKATTPKGITPLHGAILVGFGVLCFYIGRADSLSEQLEQREKYNQRQRLRLGEASQIQYLHPTGNDFIDDTANDIIDETVHAANSFVQAAVENVQAAVVNVERAIDGVQQIEQEESIKYESENDEIIKLIVDLNSDTETIKTDQITYQTKQLKSKLESSKSAIHFKYDPADWNWQSYNFSAEIPNPDFIFHNKLPKSGGTTLVYLLDKLSKINDFTLRKIEPAFIDGDKMPYEKPLVEYVRKEKKEPFLMLKHHFYFDFRRHGLRQPTMINVIRDPVDWFVSQYYFRRFGWKRNSGTRQSNIDGLTYKYGDENNDMSINECISSGHPECDQPIFKYIPYLCGNTDLCRALQIDMKSKGHDRWQKAAEAAKRNVMKSYFVIGILEQFEDTLTLFETVMPKFFGGIKDVWKTDGAQEYRNKTKTNQREEITMENRIKMMSNGLRYEIDLYYFVRALFNTRLDHYGIKRATPIATR